MKKVLLTLISILLLIFISFSVTNKKNTQIVHYNNIEYRITYPYYSINPIRRSSEKLIIDYIPKLLSERHPFSKDTLFSYSLSNKTHLCKIKAPKEISYVEIEHLLRYKYESLHFDTTQISCWNLKTNQFSQNSELNHPTMLADFNTLTQNIRNLTGQPISLECDTNFTFEISTKFLEINNIEKIASFLSDNYNIILDNSRENSMTLIKFYTK